MSQENKTILWCILWLGCFAMAFIHAAATPKDFGLSGGFKRIGIFLMWQLGAIVMAIAAATSSRKVSREDFGMLRRVALLPAGIMTAGILFIIGVILYFAVFANQVVEQPSQPGRPTTTAPVMEPTESQ